MIKNMNIRKLFIISLIAMVGFNILSPNQSFAQKRKTRKVLLKENEALRKTIDSLKNLIGEDINLSDTTNYEDSLNLGSIDILEGEGDLFDNAVPGANSDSLLAVWYAQKRLSGTPQKVVDFDNEVFTSDIPDEVYIQNIKNMNSVIQIPYNQVVKNHIIFYTQKIQAKSRTILGLCSYYMPMFEEVFDSYDLPKELACLAIIESALNPFAVSRAKAKGIWQFMLTTGKIYGLEINSYVDERFDPEKSAHAAARYLKDAYAIFGDWALAISSYNCGAGNVNKAIKRARGSKNYWDIYKYLPRETRGYMPAFVAALYLTHYYKNYNIVPEKISLPAHVDTFRIHKNLHFEQIAENLDITVEELRVLNPQYIRDIIPAHTSGYILKLPFNHTPTFIEKENEIYAYKDSIYFNPILYSKYKAGKGGDYEESKIYHKVRKGQTLGGIANRYKVTVAQLKRWNNLKSNTLRIGQNLVIYKNGAPIKKVNTNKSVTSNVEKASNEDANKKEKYKTYTIKKGDNLYGIARKHGMSLNELLKLNGLTTKSKIFAGKKLKVKN